MRYLRLALLPLVFAACTEQAAVAPIEDGPAFHATVTKELQYRNPSRITWLDSEDAWDVLLIGYDPADDPECNGGEFGGGIPVLEHYVVAQEGFPFGERVRDLVTTIGRPPLHLYLRADFPPDDATSDDWCTFLTEGWIAAGTWHAVIGIDNDVSGFDGTPGNNSFGGTETGVLLGKDGTRYKYSWKYRAHCDPDKGCSVMHSVDRVERVGR